MNNTVTDNMQVCELPMERRNIVGLAGLGGIEEIRKVFDDRISIWKYILDRIEKEFEKGIDYGPADSRNPKDTLLQPGAQKVCGWMNCHPEWVNDRETWEMLGKPENTICYKCLLVSNSSGQIIGEGRGAERVGNKGRDANKSIKNAEKCSLVDSVIYTFMLSERFTQDKKEKQNLNDGKNFLVQSVVDSRKNIKSSLTDNQFIIKVCEQVIHKKSINTKQELALVAEAISNGEFDFSTGERLPE